MPKVPDRWLDYKSMGQIIEGTRILAMKVPLSTRINENLPEEQRFNYKDMMDTAEKGGFKIGKVVDLTYSKKYYNPACFKDNGIKYHKIFVPGQIIPPDKVVSEFTSVMKEFEENCESEIVAVHCTHGLNRTGYLVCRYLVEEKNFKANDAIDRFNSARGHKIERQNYLDHLHTLESGVKTSKPSGEKNTQRPVKSKPSEDYTYFSRHQNDYSSYNQHHWEDNQLHWPQNFNRYNNHNYSQGHWNNWRHRPYNPYQHGNYSWPQPPRNYYNSPRSKHYPRRHNWEDDSNYK